MVDCPHCKGEVIKDINLLCAGCLEAIKNKALQEMTEDLRNNPEKHAYLFRGVYLGEREGTENA